MRAAFALAFALLLGCCAHAEPVIHRTPPVDFQFHQPRTWPRVDYSPSQIGERIAILHLDTQITPETASIFAVLMRSLIGAKEIVVEVDTYGGNVSSALDIMASIIDAPAPVTCVVTGGALSAGFAILQACPVRMMEDDALLMIHKATWVYPAPNILEELLRAQALEKLNHDFAMLACAKLNFTFDECYRHFFDGDWYMDATEALRVGAVDRVISSAKLYEEQRRFPQITLEGFLP